MMGQSSSTGQAAARRRGGGGRMVRIACVAPGGRRYRIEVILTHRRSRPLRCPESEGWAWIGRGRLPIGLAVRAVFEN